MQQVFYMFFIEPVVFYTSCTKTEIIYKITFYMKTYDCILQYVQISAYSHNFQTNTHFTNFSFLCFYHLTCSNMSLYMFLY